MRKLGVVLLLMAGVALVLFGLIALAARGASALVLLAMATGVAMVAWAWWIDRPRPSPLAGDAFPAPHLPLEVRVAPRKLAGFGVLILFLGCVLGFGALAALRVPQPGWIALLIGSGLAGWFMFAGLRNQPLLRLESRGLTHRGLGFIPWSEIEGIRVDNIRASNTDSNLLVLRLRDPERYMAQASWWQRAGLKRSKLVSVQLNFIDVDPLVLFEAATRWRGAIEPPALTSWNGQSKLQPSLLERLKTGLKDSPEDKRILALQLAMSGSWSRNDTREMADERLSLLRLRKQHESEAMAAFDRDLQAAVARNASEAEIRAMFGRMENIFSKEGLPVGLRGRQDVLDRKTTTRSRWTNALTVAAVIVFVLLRIWLKSR